ncbi:MAG: gamma-glutamyltransferase [Bacteroidetes bacterium]|nr:gamma-glutamyltransferase [Bacteroidota bacterium]
MKNKLIILVAASFIHTIGLAQLQWLGSGKKVDPFHYSQKKEGSFSMMAIASAHPLASSVGAEIMKEGGNAFDAAIAVQLVLAVVYPDAGNLGGGGFLLGRNKSGDIIAIDFRESAPGLATKDMYLDKNGAPQHELSVNGHLSVGIPGTVAGLFKTLPYAKLSFEKLIEPAIELAEKGFAITEIQAKDFNELKPEFLKYNTQPIAFIKNTDWKAGDILVQPELAETLKRIQLYGPKGFYEGKTAELLVAEINRGNGIISLTDLKNYEAKMRVAISSKYRGYTVLGFPPPSSGGIIVSQLLTMVEPYPLKKYGYGTIQSMHLMIEAERRAFADRAKYMGDPDFWKVPQKTLLSNAYLTNRMKDFDPLKASPSKNIQPGEIPESDQTTHISIMDAEGNMVSITTTLNNRYGSKTVVGGAGFFLNDEMDDFSMKPGVPNLYGAVGGAANAIAPGKRMLSSMAPTLILKNGNPFCVLGTPGGTTIPTSVFQMIVDMVDFGMNATDAVNKPKFHHQWLPDEVKIEKGFSVEIEQGLENMGYKLRLVGGIGRSELIKILPDGKFEVAADRRGDDSVAGY